MPKLTGTKAAEVKKAGEEGAFPLFPIGLTRLKLRDVTTGKSRGGDPQWTWDFGYVEHLEPTDEHPDTTKYAGKSVKYWTTIKDDTLWDVDRVFAAFDAEPDTDTDELIGEEIVVAIDQSLARGGRNRGEMQSEIVKFYTLKDGLAAAEAIVAQSGRSTARAAEPKAAAKATKQTAEPAF